MSGTHSDPDVSVVGSGARIKGTLVSTGSVEIHGQVSGKISVQGEVFLCASSQVQADIQAGSINQATQTSSRPGTSLSGCPCA